MPVVSPSASFPVVHSNASWHEAPRARFLGGGLIALTLTRWLLPTEATADGETLWIAGLWLLAGAALAWQYRATAAARRLDAADLAVGLLIGGHVASGLVVVCIGGDRRAAVNLVWEWLSLGVFWLAWRDWLTDSRMRRALVPVILITTATLSTWGMWQYFVWYPQIQAKYGPLFDQLHELEQHGGDTAAVRRQLSEAGIPTDGPSLLLFENRIRQSREPFGPFALANTFGGLLATWLVACVCILLDHVFGKQSVHRRSAALVAALSSLLVLTAGCLYLTNSRTAWTGAILSLIVGGVAVLTRRISSSKLRQLIIPLCGAAAFVAAIAGLRWIISGQHDVPGPLKSLAYRTEYWIGAWRLLESTPWIGPGLGQFRDRYLAYRLPESSEEIADPHNFVLDVWANGGLIALAGLFGLVGALFHRVWKLSQEPHPQGQSTLTKGACGAAAWALPGVAAFGMAIVGQWVTTGLWDEHLDRLALVAGAWMGLAWLFSHVVDGFGDAWNWAGPLGALALTIHLLGAGGIGMPAVTQLWLLLIALGLPAVVVDSRPMRATFAAKFALCLTCGVLFATWFVTGWLPTSKANRAIAEGDAIFSATGDADRAERLYRQAAGDDWLSAEPWQRLADVGLSRLRVARGRVADERLEEDLRRQDEAIRRAPFRYYGYLRKGELLAEKARRTKSTADWDACVDAYRAAERRHPTNVRLLADFALILSEAGRRDDAALTARRALEQDERNRRRGHTDRYLPTRDVERLEALAGG
jgi:hypothetical protein